MKLELLDRGESIAWIRLEGRLDLKGVEEVLRIAGLEQVAVLAATEDEALRAVGAS